MTIRVFTWLRSLLHRDKRPLLPLQARSDGAAIGGSGIVLDGQEISSEIDRARLDSIATVVSDEKEVMPIEYSNMGKSSKQTHPGQDEGMEISYAEHTFSFPQWHISNKSEPAGKDSSSSNTGSESAGTTKDGAKMETAADDPSPRPAWYRRKFNHSILGCSLSIELWMILLIVAVALAVGLGVGLGTRKDHLIFGAAFPATGIVAIDLADGQRNFDSFLMATNRSVVQTKFVNGSWATQSTAVDLVSNLIRDASPLMAVSYTYEDELSWRVMFVGKDGYLQEVISNNKTEDWWEGSLGAGRFKYHPDGIGLTSCVNKKYYGQPDDELGLRLYYSSSEGTIQELIWVHGSEVWTKGYSFQDSTAAGGCECVVRGTSTTHVWVQNKAGALQQYWYDFDNSTASPTHITQQWVKGVTATGLRNGTAIAAIQVNQTRYIHYQADDGMIWQITAQNNAENTTLNAPISVGDAYVGTKLSALVLNTDFSGQEIHVFAQMKDMTVTDYVRTLNGGTWATGKVPIYI